MTTASHANIEMNCEPIIKKKNLYTKNRGIDGATQKIQRNRKFFND